MKEPKTIGSAVVTVDCDTSAAMSTLDEIEKRALEVGSAFNFSATPEPSMQDVVHALRRFVIRVAGKEAPTAAELEAMAKVGVV